MIDTDHDGVESFVAANREDLVEVIKHSNNTYARACAWAILDAGTGAPSLEQLQDELQHLQREGTA